MRMLPPPEWQVAQLPSKTDSPSSRSAAIAGEAASTTEAVTAMRACLTGAALRACGTALRAPDTVGVRAVVPVIIVASSNRTRPKGTD